MIMILHFTISITNIHQYYNIKILNYLNNKKINHLSQQHFMKVNQLLAQIDLLNIMSQHNCHNTVFDNVIQWAMYWNNNQYIF